MTTVSSGVQTNWVTSASSPDSPSNAAFTADAANIGENSLYSPTVAVVSATATLSFRQSYSFDYDPGSAYDGGVFEIKIAGGSFQDILAAGGSFASNGYNNTLIAIYGNPLSGRQAWGGSSTGYVTTVVNLPAAAAGKNVQFRWRTGTDNGIAGLGWWVDGVTLTDTACCTLPPPSIVRLLPTSGTNLIVQSTGHNVYPLSADYTTNLAGPQTWQPATVTTTWSNGTNTTTFTTPPGANPAFIRVKQANGP